MARLISYCTSIVISILKKLSGLLPKDKRLILFGAFLGEKYGDNSGYLFEYCSDNYFSIYNSIWLTNRKTIVKEVRSKGRKAYLKFSLKGLLLTLRAKVIVTSHGSNDVLIAPITFHKIKEIYCHHGIPLRGAKINSSGIPNRSLYLEQSKNLTYMLATSKWGGKQQIKNIPTSKRKVQITGYPRNDVLTVPDLYINEVLKMKQSYNLNKKVILYAPTWRKWEAVKFFPFNDYKSNELALFFRRNNISIIIRPHSVDLKRKRDIGLEDQFKDYRDVYKIISHNDCNKIEILLLCSDILITDYSSIFYDYLLLNRPILFIPYDIREYEKRNGKFNSDYFNHTPGHKIMNQNYLIDILSKLLKGNDEYYDERLNLKHLAYKYTDGQSCKRVSLLIDQLLLN